jgi:hypothetical protein
MSGGWLQTWNNNMPAGREIRFHSTRRAPPHYPHAADSEHGPPLSENDLAKNGQGRPRSVPAKRDCVERGKSRREIFALITTPPLVRVDPWIWQGKETLFFFFFFDDNSIRYGFAFSQRTLHKFTKQGGSSYGKLRREGCCVFLSGIPYIWDGPHPHLTFVNTHKRLSTNIKVRW